MRRVPLALLLLCLCFLPVRAGAETDTAADGLPPEAKGLLSGTPEAPETEKTLNRLLKTAGETLGKTFRTASAEAAGVVGTAVLCSLVSASLLPRGEQGMDYVTAAGALGITALSAGGISSFLRLAEKTVDELSTYSGVILPVMVTASGAAGRPTAGAAQYAVTAFFMDLLVTAAKSAVIPMICGYTAASFGAAALGNEGLRQTAALMKRLVTSLLTVLTLCFTLFITTAGAITGQADATAAKLTRTAIATTLPVVGGIVSDAANAVVTAAGMIRGAVGLYGLLAVCAVCLVPVLRMAVYHLMFKAAGALAGAAADGRLAGLIGAMGDAVGMMLGVTGECAMMLFLALCCLIRMGAG